MTDRELLDQIARQQSEAAFTEIVRRHLGLVYSAAVRQLGSPDEARDVAQSVFIRLARQCAQLKSDVVLTGWLYRTTRNLCLETNRKQRRQREREQAAAANLMTSETANPWDQIAPVLEPAMDELTEAERQAVLLRFFQNKSLREVGAALGVGEDAAQKRVGRALDRLRDIFGKRSITLPAAVLATAISGGAIQTAPAAVLSFVTTSALASGMVATTSLLTQSTSTTMNLLNLKTAAVVLAAAAVTGTSTYFVKEHQATRLRADYQSLKELQTRFATAQQQATATIQLRDEQIEQLRKEVAELPRLRGEVDKLNRELDSLNKLRAQNEQLIAEAGKLRAQLQAATATTVTERQAEKMEFEKRRRESIEDLKALGLALRIYANDHNDLFPKGLDSPEFQPALLEAGRKLSDRQNYEQVYFGRADPIVDGVNGGIPHVQSSNTVVVRQREPMVDPDGNRIKCYTTADGAVQTVTESMVGGSFEQFERNWTVNHKPILFVLPQPN
ncbi:sigma-70 family RNA polymerase sigma factor [bacterium]|nr:sigma-70 family RNA polymerase sigma factor [bacterium]